MPEFEVLVGEGVLREDTATLNMAKKKIPAITPATINANKDARKYLRKDLMYKFLEC